MTAPSASLLSTRRSGPPDGPPVLLLHDRYGDLDTAGALASHAAPGSRTVSVQAPRLQTIGGLGQVRGHYWYFGDKLTPELSTLGDALFQLETLALEAADAHPSGNASLVGHGEGGVMALLIALIWPEKIASLTIIDADLPANLGEIPIEARPLEGLPVTLIACTPATAEALRARGATVHLSAA